MKTLLRHIGRGRGGIRRKLLTMMSCLIIALLTTLTVIQIAAEKKNLEKEMERRTSLIRTNLIDRGKMLSEHLAPQVENGIATFNFSGILELLKKTVQQNKGTYAILTDVDRKAYIHTLRPELQQQTLADEEDLRAASQKNLFVQEYRKENASYMEFVIPIRVGTSPWGVMRLVFSMQKVNDEIVNSQMENKIRLNELVIRSVFISLIFVIIGSAVVLWISARISKPLISLTASARKLAEGDFTVAPEIKVASEDEIGVLSSAFADMASQLNISYTKIGEYSRTLEAKVEERTLELQQAKEAADSANRSKTEFLASMSHEIRTPMNAVLGFADLLSSLIKDEKQKNYLEAIRAGGKSLLTLIDDILDLSKIEAGKLELRYEPIRLRTIFEEIRHIFSLKISEKGLEFITEISSEVPDSMILDEVRLRQILFNLIGNAVKFTSEGHIKISAKCKMRNAKCEEMQNAKCNVRNDLSESVPTTLHFAFCTLHLSIEDTGIGISPEFHDRIFDAFQQQDGQSNKQYGGTGLGLTITRRLTDMMGGMILLHSEPDKGSRFTLIFPDVMVGDTSFRTENGKSPDHENITFRSATILIADDVESNRNLLKADLENMNIRILEAANGEEAVVFAGQHIPDTILMDIRMPIADGYEAARRIKNDETLRHIPIIAVTASVLPEERSKILRSGFDGYVPKPVRKADLFRELCRFLPYTEESAKCEIPGEKRGIGNLSPETLKRLPDLIETLENELTPLWKAVSESRMFDDIENFADKIRLSGEEYAFGMLADFGKEMMTHCRNCDIENMFAAMNSFPDLTDTIKAMRKESSDERDKKQIQYSDC